MSYDWYKWRHHVNRCGIQKTLQHSPFHRLTPFLLKIISWMPVPGQMSHLWCAVIYLMCVCDWLPLFVCFPCGFYARGLHSKWTMQCMLIYCTIQRRWARALLWSLADHYTGGMIRKRNESWKLGLLFHLQCDLLLVLLNVQRAFVTRQRNVDRYARGGKGGTRIRAVPLSSCCGILGWVYKGFLPTKLGLVKVVTDWRVHVRSTRPHVVMSIPSGMDRSCLVRVFYYFWSERGGGGSIPSGKHTTGLQIKCPISVCHPF